MDNHIEVSPQRGRCLDVSADTCLGVYAETKEPVGSGSGFYPRGTKEVKIPLEELLVDNTHLIALWENNISPCLLSALAARQVVGAVGRWNFMR